MEGCDAVVSVSDREARHIVDHGFPRVSTLAYALEITPTPSPFEAREGILFVGGIYADSPNWDWWCGLSGRSSRGSVTTWRLTSRWSGRSRHPSSGAWSATTFEFTGRVDDLAPIYDQMRIFVAPTRFAAGIPLKLCEAAAQGIPIVATRLLAGAVGVDRRDRTPGRRLSARLRRPVQEALPRRRALGTPPGGRPRTDKKRLFSPPLLRESGPDLRRNLGIAAEFD